MSEDRYTVCWLTEAATALAALVERARAVAVYPEFREALLKLNGRLAVEPLEVGELYHGLGAVKDHIASYKFIGIEFGIDTKQQVVAVRKCWALPYSGL